MTASRSAPLGQVNLNTRLVLNTTEVEILTLEGFDGDDTFTLVPAISAERLLDDQPQRWRAGFRHR